MAQTSKDSAVSAPSESSSAWRQRVKAVLPWIIAAAAIPYVFSRVPISEVWAETQSADLLSFTAVIFGAQAFGINLPFALALAATPIIQAAGGLPISPMGLGTQQTAMLYSFGSRSGRNKQEAAIVAFGFSFPVALNLGRCLLGLFYVMDLTDSKALAATEYHASASPTEAVPTPN